MASLGHKHHDYSRCMYLPFIMMPNDFSKIVNKSTPSHCKLTECLAKNVWWFVASLPKRSGEVNVVTRRIKQTALPSRCTVVGFYQWVVKPGQLEVNSPLRSPKITNTQWYSTILSFVLRWKHFTWSISEENTYINMFFFVILMCFSFPKHCLLK